MRVALVSLDQKWLNKEANFEACIRYTKQAAEEECSLIIFPEMTLTGFSPDTPSILEPTVESQTLKRFGDLAECYSIDIIFGACLQELDRERPSNNLCLATSDGQANAIYRKMHLFSYAQEEKYYSAGDKTAIHKISGINFGFAVCYDLRFPELFSLMANDIQAVVVIANWPASRLEHWSTLLRARAIENQSMVIGVNRVGVDGNGLEYEKSTIVVQSDGDILRPRRSSRHFDIYEIDREQVLSNRKKFPTLRDKRTNLYKTLV